jgi:DNA segregation ATPase FtsK/SpoIIIE, S-DNA-T family
MSVHPRDKTSEALGLLFLAAAGILALALFTYNPADPSFTLSVSTERHLNYVGRFGSWTSDLLFLAFGLGAFLIPLPFLLVGYKKLRNRSVDYPFVKLLGFFGLVLSVSTLLSLLTVPRGERFDFVPGGVLGIVSGDHLVLLFNQVGSVIVATTFLFVSMLLVTRFSFDRTLGWLGARDWNVFSRLSFRYQQWKKRRADRRELSRIKRDKKAVVVRKVGVPVADPAPEMPPTTWELPSREEEFSEPVIERFPLPRHEGLASAAKPKLESYRLPDLNYLQAGQGSLLVDEKELNDRSDKLVAKYAEFGVAGSVIHRHPGPVVTTFEFKPEAGVRYSKVISMAEDLCLALRAESIRIDRIPGKNTVGIEVPNLTRQTIFSRDIFASPAFQDSGSYLTLGLGKRINGETFVTDLTGMPHLLIAGATGSGKSVGVNCMVCSILYKASPADVRFIMIDPKRLELGVYEGIPHLLTPIVTDPRQASNALEWAVREMEKRYKKLAEKGVRNIEQYNEELRQSRGENPEDTPLPYIVIIVDELADLMMTAGKEVEAALARLAQMARAIGIHLILATQRPSVDVLTGLIKANFPCRISFRVSSKVDSRTILDANGAEQLLGHGDMLFLSPRTSRLVRVHGAFISEKEIALITGHLKRQAAPEYQEEILQGDVEEGESSLVDVGDLEDDLYEEAARFVVETGKASTSMLQRRFRIGYGRAARLLDIMQHEGVVGPPDGSKAREVLVPPDYFDVSGV